MGGAGRSSSNSSSIGGKDGHGDAWWGLEIRGGGGYSPLHHRVVHSTIISMHEKLAQQIIIMFVNFRRLGTAMFT